MTSSQIAIALTTITLAASVARADEHEAAGEAHEHEHSPFELRVSVEAPMIQHVSGHTANVADEFEPELDAMVSYVLVPKQLSVDLEIGEALLLHTSEPDVSTPKRAGTTIRPGATYSPTHELPLYVTALLPMHLEPSPFLLGLRLGVGVDFHVPVGKFFVEADVDFSLAGGTGAPSAFKKQDVVLATGLLFHLPK